MEIVLAIDVHLLDERVKIVSVFFRVFVIWSDLACVRRQMMTPKVLAHDTGVVEEYIDVTLFLGDLCSQSDCLAL